MQRNRNEGAVINLIVQIGFALCIASSVLFHVRLYQLNVHLRDNYPRMWKLFGTGNSSMSLTQQYRCMTKLSTEFEVSDEELNRRFISLRQIHRSSAVSALVLIVGLVYEFAL